MDYNIVAVLVTDADVRNFLENWHEAKPKREKPVRFCADCRTTPLVGREQYCLRCLRAHPFAWKMRKQRRKCRMAGIVRHERDVSRVGQVGRAAECERTRGTASGV